MEGQELNRPKKARKKYEVVILLVVIVAAVVVAFGIYSARGKTQRSELMMSELEQIRSSIITYKTLNKSNPPDLVSLTKMTYTFAPGEEPRPYLTKDISTNAKGELVDPFGNPYNYNEAKGWVYSSTKEYKNW